LYQRIAQCCDSALLRGFKKKMSKPLENRTMDELATALVEAQIRNDFEAISRIRELMRQSAASSAKRRQQPAEDRQLPEEDFLE
jgi:hypothetical protein